MTRLRMQKAILHILKERKAMQRTLAHARIGHVLGHTKFYSLHSSSVSDSSSYGHACCVKMCLVTRQAISVISPSLQMIKI